MDGDLQVMAVRAVRIAALGRTIFSDGFPQGLPLVAVRIVL